jgi:hypothetical protein
MILGAACGSQEKIVANDVKAEATTLYRAAHSLMVQLAGGCAFGLIPE